VSGASIENVPDHADTPAFELDALDDQWALSRPPLLDCAKVGENFPHLGGRRLKHVKRPDCQLDHDVD
jgi:hypothetical protein